ncbi:MarR family transcriptional regulator [Frankia sp. Cppng1_Ct_nod]|uniref:MarR family winged helix-turn-helix transcriptional regulator n=1 Tax=Frankia sp. Cppng1_Ct_nod TaxID=2897162 RepID=UPI001041866C|nr:MarR family transcriptional regulator [Frankia sp. Cppng1_Ct_nod]
MVDERTGAQEPLVDPRSMRAWRTFLRAHSYVTRQLETDLEGEHHLQLASYDVLVQLAEAPDGALRMNELAEAVLLSRSGLTRLVDRLERDGLVERRSCPSDARGTLATLTPEGRKRLRAAARTHLAGVSKHVTSHFSPDELDILADLLSRLDRRSSASTPGGGCGQSA